MGTERPSVPEARRHRGPGTENDNTRRMDNRLPPLVSKLQATECKGRWIPTDPALRHSGDATHVQNRTSSASHTSCEIEKTFKILKLFTCITSFGLTLPFLWSSLP